MCYACFLAARTLAAKRKDIDRVMPLLIRILNEHTPEAEGYVSFSDIEEMMKGECTADLLNLIAAYDRRLVQNRDGTGIRLAGTLQTDRLILEEPQDPADDWDW